MPRVCPRTLTQGELRIVVPRIEERRGQRDPSISGRRLVKLLFIGDIFGKPGRDLVRGGLPRLVERHADRPRHRQRGEQRRRASASPARLARSCSLGRRRDDLRQPRLGQEGSADYLGRSSRACCARPTTRPACPARAASSRAPAHGDEVGVLNLMGRVFMLNIDDPFAMALREVDGCARARRSSSSTSTPKPPREKVAMGWHLDGLVTRGGRHAHARADRRRAASCPAAPRTSPTSA